MPNTVRTYKNNDTNWLLNQYGQGNMPNFALPTTKPGNTAKPTTPANTAAVSGYNGSSDFLKWYKNLYGTDYNPSAGLVRAEGMSDGDWNVGTILHNYYLKNQQNEADRAEKIESINQRYNSMADTAKFGFDNARQTLGENKAAAQQNASITYDRLRKYLPMKARAQGLGGLGTESSDLEAYNTYMTQMGGIASDYQNNMRAIDNEETSSLSELEMYRADSLDEADELYDALGRSYGDNADKDAREAMERYIQGEKTSKDEAFAIAQSIIQNSTSANVNELMAYVNGLEGKVSPEQLTALQQIAKAKATANSNAESGQMFNSVAGIIANYSGTDINELLEYVNRYYDGKTDSVEYATLIEAANTRVEENKNTQAINQSNLAATNATLSDYYSAEIMRGIEGGMTTEEIESLLKEYSPYLTPVAKAEIEKKIYPFKKLKEIGSNLVNGFENYFGAIFGNSTPKN